MRGPPPATPFLRDRCDGRMELPLAGLRATRSPKTPGRIPGRAGMPPTPGHGGNLGCGWLERKDFSRGPRIQNPLTAILELLRGKVRLTSGVAGVPPALPSWGLSRVSVPARGLTCCFASFSQLPQSHHVTLRIRAMLSKAEFLTVLGSGRPQEHWT